MADSELHIDFHHQTFSPSAFSPSRFSPTNHDGENIDGRWRKLEYIYRRRSFIAVELFWSSLYIPVLTSSTSLSQPSTSSSRCCIYGLGDKYMVLVSLNKPEITIWEQLPGVDIFIATGPTHRREMLVRGAGGPVLSRAGTSGLT